MRCQATVELLDLKPASIEHIDRVLFDQTKGQLQFQPARDLLELDATSMNSSCCGMAGAFAALDSKYELSIKVAQPLVRGIAAQPPNTTIVASGTSCRHQIEHLTPVQPRDMAEVLADALA
jgi:Fe-S oxidoreductase